MYFYNYSREDYLNIKCSELFKDALEIRRYFTDGEMTLELTP